MTEFPRARRHNGLLVMLKLLLLCLGLGALVGASAALLAPIGEVPGLVLGALVIMIGMTAGMGASWWWWRGLDEAAREAHKWAWFWGGSSGMALCFSLLLAAGLRPEALNLALEGVSAARLVTASIATMMACQMIGYGVAWGAWWLRHR